MCHVMLVKKVFPLLLNLNVLLIQNVKTWPCVCSMNNRDDKKNILGTVIQIYCPCDSG